MELYPVNSPQLPLPPETISQAQYQNDLNKTQYYPQSPPPLQYPGQPAGTPMFYPQDQPMQTYPYPPPPPQNQQQSVVVVSAPAPMIIQQSPLESYIGHQIFACVVLWCCNWLFGLIAWILALVADTHTKFSDRKAAQRLGKASLGLSISGIIVTVIVVAIALGVTFGLRNSINSSRNSGSTSISTSTSTSTSSCLYTLNGVCYTSRRLAINTCSSNIYSFSTCCYSYEDAYSNYYCYSGYSSSNSGSTSISTSTSTSSCLYTLNGVCYTSRRLAINTCSSNIYSFSTCCYSYEDAYSNYYCYSGYSSSNSGSTSISTSTSTSSCLYTLNGVCYTSRRLAINTCSSNIYSFSTCCYSYEDAYSNYYCYSGYSSSNSGSTSISTSTSTSSCLYTLNGVCYTSRRYAYNTCSSSYFKSFRSCCYSYEDAYSNYYCYSG